MQSIKPHPPVIIRKRRARRAEAGHHGGAWKVAYADFVTAMMAFFLLMWLLNATTEEQRKGLADYFNPSIPISRISGGGDGALNGSSAFSEQDFARDGVGASEPFVAPTRHERRDAEALRKAEAARAALAAVEKRIAEERAKGGDELADHIETRMTPDGLVVELLDDDETPLFAIGSAAPSSLLFQLLDIVGPVLATAANDMAIVGHTDARAYARNGPYTNWELSSDRAHAARRLLIARSIPSAQIVSVIGRADRDPIDSNPIAARNRRIAVILLAPAAR